MCEFISWISVNRGGKVKNLFLTDADVYSDYGKEILQRSAHNDFLGHGAIRVFYKLDCGEGTEYEARDFWKNKELPKEIRKKIENFDIHWGKMFKAGVFQNDDLRYLVENAPEAWKEKAWNRLLKQNPSNDDLCCLVAYAPKAWKEKAWEQLLEQNPSNDDLCYLVAYAPKAWKEKVNTLIRDRQ